MVLDTSLVDSHRAYVTAVAAALTEAGVTVTDVDFFDDLWTDADPDRRGGARIDVATTAAGRAGRQLWVAYSEESGWTLYVHHPAANRIESSHPLCAEVVPAPAEVGAAAAATLAIGKRPRASTTPKSPIRAHSSDSEDA
ncbi:DUF6292 family protein [Streptomyces sp. NBC_01590]|uniref:DUF6292 family protein n=1 Tax=Streptomyces sp. NBC_01590 TaxID=2975887 RepID=UPI00386E781B